MEPANVLSRLRQFDAYPKTLEDFRVKTYAGAAGKLTARSASRSSRSFLLPSSLNSDSDISIFHFKFRKNCSDNVQWGKNINYRQVSTFLFWFAKKNTSCNRTVTLTPGILTTEFVTSKWLNFRSVDCYLCISLDHDLGIFVFYFQ